MKQIKPKRREPKPVRLTIVFPRRAVYDEFRGWLSDGGGEQAFMADVEHLGDNDIGSLDFDYDGHTVVVTELPRVPQSSGQANERKDDG